MEIIKIYLFLGVLIFLIGFAALTVNTDAIERICACWPQATVGPTAIVEPTVEPTIIPEPTITEEPKVAPEPTVEEITPTAGQSGQQGNAPVFAESTTNANNPKCNGVYPDKPVLQGFKVINSTTDEYSWWGSTNADKYSVVYGYSPDSLVYGVDNINKNATSIQLGNLRPNTQSWAQIWAWRGECVNKSNIFN